MINFKQPQEVLPSIMILVSLVVLAAAGCFLVLFPMPSADAVDQAGVRSRHHLESQLTFTNKLTAADQARISPRLWTGDPEVISASILDQLTALTSHSDLKLGAFRPQRPRELDSVAELQFTAQVSGPFPQVQALMDTFNKPKSKVVLRSVQLASSDEISDDVTASLGLSAYVVTDPSLLQQTTGDSHG